MKGIYVVSTSEYAGKSTIAITIAINLKNMGKKVAYMKPIGTMPSKVEGVDTCEDVDYIWNELGKPGDIRNVCPIVLLANFTEKAFGKEKKDYKKVVKDAAFNLAKDHDFLVLEGAGNINQGSFIGLSAAQVASLLNLKTILIAKYSDILTIDEILEASAKLKANIAGVIINMVPEHDIDTVENIIKPFLNERNIKYLGYLKKDRILSSVSIGKIAEYLQGRILSGKKYLHKMVESFMVGAMGQEQAISFFRKKANKAVITGGDRSDVQLAALETATNVLILTGNLNPRPLVISKAEDEQVPIILVKEDTLSAIEKTEELISRERVHENQKILHMKELLEKNIDLSAIYKDMGLVL